MSVNLNDGFDNFLDSVILYIDGVSDMHTRVSLINKIKERLHHISPFKNEPVDCVLWVRSDNVIANDYNPNSVAPPEMILLETSITEDGYTQPIVTWGKKDSYEIIDGFHRNRVGKESENIKTRLGGYLPVTVVNSHKTDRGNRMASTIRHNRARGKHSVDVMSDIVLELKNRNWTNARIAKQLGMDEDEILRLCQITGLANLFSDDDFSKSWDIEKSSPDGIKFEKIEYIVDDNLVNDGDEKTITMNTSEKERVFHTYDKWECYRYNFYGTSVKGKTSRECEEFYAEFLRDIPRFERALSHIIKNWKHSCEHYLTNYQMNRIAWLGQASVAYDSGIPSKFCSGFSLLSEIEQNKANECALKYLNKFLKNRGMDTVDMDNATAKGRTSVLY